VISTSPYYSNLRYISYHYLFTLFQNGVGNVPHNPLSVKYIYMHTSTICLRQTNKNYGLFWFGNGNYVIDWKAQHCILLVNMFLTFWHLSKDSSTGHKWIKIFDNHKKPLFSNVLSLLLVHKHQCGGSFWY